MQLTVLNDTHVDALRELDARLDGEVRLGAHDRDLYATDASIYEVRPPSCNEPGPVFRDASRS